MIPANPKTYVVSVNPESSLGYIKEPIVAWAEDPKEPLAHPIPLTMHGQRRLIGGDSILFPCGMVSDPKGNIAYESVEEWLNAGPGTRSLAEDAKARPAPGKPASYDAEEGSGDYDIEFSGAPYKSNSWWHYDDGQFEFVFQIEGGEDTPKTGGSVVKIKRTDFQEMKKTLDVLTLEEIKAGNDTPTPPETYEDEDEDDDGDDLI